MRPPSRAKSWQRASAAMMLGLTLCCAGCAHRTRLASVHPGPMGNAVLATLPMGTVLELPTAECRAQLGAAFVNELEVGSAAASEAIDGGDTRSPRSADRRLRLKALLKLCTPAYVAERDIAELELWRQIEALKIENQQLRLK
jgi:hypothetical protein